MSESTNDREQSATREGSVRAPRSRAGAPSAIASSASTQKPTTQKPTPQKPAKGDFRTFLHVLVNTALANVTTSFLWFALTFWMYAETRNVITTGVVGGAYMLFIAVFSMFFGTLVDRFKKKAVMLWATLSALVVFLLDAIFFFAIGEDRITDLTQPWIWIFAVVMLAGAVVEQLRSIALSTTVTLLVPEERRANANGLVGTVQGLAMLVTSVFSGLAVGFLGMGWTLIIGIVALTLTLLHLVPLRMPEPTPVRAEGQTNWVDVRGGWLAVVAAPGLFALVLFTTLNNIFGGVQMALIDPYGIDMFGVQGWGIVFAIASSGFIIGGLVVAKTGLGRNPIRTMLGFAALVGVVGALFTIREQPWLFIVGIWVIMGLFPVIEAAEQTVIQRLVPYESQGRVFGFAMTFEAGTAPITAFLIAPIAEIWIIPALRTSEGQERWEWLLGSGDSRGIALVLFIAGVGCTLLAIAAFLSPQYRQLSRRYVSDTPLLNENENENAGENHTGS